MKFTRRAAMAALASVGLIAGATFAAAPASATINIDAMFGLDYHNNTPLYSIDHTNAATSTIGSAITGLNSAYGAVWSPDGTITAMDDQCGLWQIDPATGAGSRYATINGADVHWCYGLTYGPDGTLYTGIKKTSAAGGTVYIATIDVTTGNVLSNVYDDTSSASSVNFLTADFSNGKIYFQADGTHHDLMALDPKTGTAQNLTSTYSAGAIPWVYAAAITTGGGIYLSQWGSLWHIDTWADFTTPTSIGSLPGNMNVLLVKTSFPPKPSAGGSDSLAATGGNDVLAGLVGLFAVMALVAGVRLRRRTN